MGHTCHTTHEVRMQAGCLTRPVVSGKLVSVCN